MKEQLSVVGCQLSVRPATLIAQTLAQTECEPFKL